MIMASAMKCLADSDVQRLLRDWRALNDEIMGLPYEGVHQLLLAAFEENLRDLHEVRWQVIRRIYGRFNRLRMIRELDELKKGTACPGQ